MSIPKTANCDEITDYDFRESHFSDQLDPLIIRSLDL
jgi:hypothetical protein